MRLLKLREVKQFASGLAAVSGGAGTYLESMLFMAVRKLLIVADVSLLTLAWYTLHSPQSLFPRSLSPLLENRAAYHEVVSEARPAVIPVSGPLRDTQHEGNKGKPLPGRYGPLQSPNTSSRHL